MGTFGIRNRFIDLTGVGFGSLVVLAEAGTDTWGQIRWRCRCLCGQIHFAVGGKLRRGEVTSCGCAKPEAARRANTVHGASARGQMTPEYRAWQNMIYRCENASNKQWKDYGGRGIRVWSGWRRNFLRFLTDVGTRPSLKHTLDRIRNDGGYRPGNVRWSTRLEQNRNKRNTRRYTVGATTQVLSVWAEQLGCDSATLSARLNAGWSVRETLTTPIRKFKKHLADANAK